MPNALLRSFWRKRGVITVYFSVVIKWFSMSYLKRRLKSVFTYWKYWHDTLLDGEMQFYVLSTLSIYATWISKHFHVVILSDGWHFYVHKFENNESMLSRLILYLKSVNFLFCSVYLKNRSAIAVNCCVIIHRLELSCKEDQLTSAQREWFIFVQLTD